MDTQTMFEELKQAEKLITYSFMELSSLFPKLMTVQHNSSSALLREELERLRADNQELADIEVSFLDGRDEVHAPMLEKLNQEIQTLAHINEQISDIQHCSEDMELIALNAMVISIKSGERGRAFSSITENLKRLSTDMITYSGKLIAEEDILLRNITVLKQVFFTVSDSQKRVSEFCAAGTQALSKIMEDVEQPFTDIEERAALIWAPISKAMESVQMQDIIRQSLDQVFLCLQDMQDEPTLSGDESVYSALDTVALDMELYRIAAEILRDVNNKLEESNRLFETNWNSVSQILDSVEECRRNNIDRFLDSHRSDSLPERINNTVLQFKNMVDEFSHYLLVQKDLVKGCQAITDKGRAMYSVFGDLRPVISRLHHVRVLQQIEVAKNAAISAVKDSANDMDNLISRSNQSLDTMQLLIETFLSETTSLLNSFSSEIMNENTEMNTIRSKRTAFFARLQASRDEILKILNNFSVYPDGFEDKCAEVNALLKNLITANTAFSSVMARIAQETDSLSREKARLLAQAGLTHWEIHDDKFKALISKFTITAHKETAGQIVGINIESGMDAGEITFF